MTCCNEGKEEEIPRRTHKIITETYDLIETLREKLLNSLLTKLHIKNLLSKY